MKEKDKLHSNMLPLQNLLLICSLIISACDHNDLKQTEKSGKLVSRSDSTQKQSIASDPYAHKDTLTIALKAAVLFQPDSSQIQRRMKEVGEEDFRAGADDYIYYINTSAEYLEQQGLPVIDAKGRKYISFVQANGAVQVVKPDTLPELWGIYLFDPKKTPYYADITLIEEDYKKYFNQ